MKQSATKYRVCDKCDYQLSNLGFQKRLKEDLLAKKNVTKEVTTNISTLHENLSKVNDRMDQIKFKNDALKSDITEME